MSYICLTCCVFQGMGLGRRVMLTAIYCNNTVNVTLGFVKAKEEDPIKLKQGMIDKLIIEINFISQL